MVLLCSLLYSLLVIIILPILPKKSKNIQAYNYYWVYYGKEALPSLSEKGFFRDISNLSKGGILKIFN